MSEQIRDITVETFFQKVLELKKEYDMLSDEHKKEIDDKLQKGETN